MAKLQNALAKKIPVWRDEIRELNKVHGNLKIDTVTVGQAYGGMRGVKGMVCDTSEVPPDKGLIIRGIPIADLTGQAARGHLLPAVHRRAAQRPPTARRCQEDLAARAKVPAYVWKVLEAMPKDSHPMAMLDTAILAMQRESEFAKAYDEGMKKAEYWEPTLEDCLNMMARIPAIAAGIYRMRFKKGPRIAAEEGPATGRELRAHAGHPRQERRVRQLHAPVPGAAQRPRGRQRLGAHLPLRGLGALRRRTTPSPPASTAWPARCTAWPTRSAWAGSSRRSRSSSGVPTEEQLRKYSLGHAQRRQGHPRLRPRRAARSPTRASRPSAPSA